MSHRKIRLGMVGGGKGGFIGALHRIAARLDDRFELVAGAFSSDVDRNKASAQELGVPAERAYDSYLNMAARESAKPDGIEAVAIVTPNHLHFDPARAFLEASIDVICDKPVTTTMEQAIALRDLIDRTGRLFVLTHNYTGYPMVRQMREMVADDAIGKLRHVQGEYPQDWLTEALETQGAKGAEWRTDPARSGAGGAIGDIGTHIYHLASFVTGESPSHILADLSAFIEGRALDDSANILLRYANGAKGMLWASQVAVGNENAVSLRLYGDKGGLEWRQEDPNRLWFTPFGQATQMLTRNGAGSKPSAARASRIPAGHPEGYLEAFATIYNEAAQAIIAVRDGSAADAAVIYPGITDGIAGLAFVSAAVASSRSGAVWMALDPIDLMHE